MKDISSSAQNIGPFQILHGKRNTYKKSKFNVYIHHPCKYGNFFTIDRKHYKLRRSVARRNITLTHFIRFKTLFFMLSTLPDTNNLFGLSHQSTDEV
jgi:hypothetical protein